MLYCAMPCCAGPAGRDKIRLYGIDAPEKAQTCNNDKGQPYACGIVSLEALKERVGNRPVRCEVSLGLSSHCLVDGR